LYSYADLTIVKSGSAGCSTEPNEIGIALCAAAFTVPPTLPRRPSGVNDKTDTADTADTALAFVVGRAVHIVGGLSAMAFAADAEQRSLDEVATRSPPRTPTDRRLTRAGHRLGQCAGMRHVGGDIAQLPVGVL
jgi:hypothetical protein